MAVEGRERIGVEREARSHRKEQRKCPTYLSLTLRGHRGSQPHNGLQSDSA